MHPKTLLRQSKVFRQRAALEGGGAFVGMASVISDAGAASTDIRRSEGRSYGIAMSDGHAQNEKFLSERLQAISENQAHSNSQSVTRSFPSLHQPDLAKVRPVETRSVPLQRRDEAISMSTDLMSRRNSPSRGTADPFSSKPPSDMQV